jgi:hypothetical protein
MKIHITNYLGSDAQANKLGTTIRQSRERTLGLVLDALNNHWQGVEVVLWNQQPYQPKHSHVCVIDTIAQPVASARNEILRNFYASDDDWCAIFDNDIGVYHDDKDRLDTNEFIANPKAILDQLTGKVASFALFFPQQTPYDAIKSGNKWSNDVLSNWLFLPTIHLNGLVFHSNYPKLYGQEFYYDQTLDIMDDLDFAIQLWRAGLFVGKLQNVFMKEYSNKSTIFKTEPTFMPYKNRGARAKEGKMDWDDKQDRNQRMALAKKVIEQKYSCSWEELYPKTSSFRLVKPTSKFAQLFEEIQE